MPILVDIGDLIRRWRARKNRDFLTGDLSLVPEKPRGKPLIVRGPFMPDVPYARTNPLRELAKRRIQRQEPKAD